MKNISIAALIFVIFLSGCSNFTFNATICDQIASDPNAPQIPQECKVYKEEEATKAFNNDKKSDFNPDESVEFNK